jgi:hypothetical protein
MKLDNSRVLCLSQYLQQILITKEVKSWEFTSLDFQEIIESFLAPLLLLVDVVKSLLQTFNVC